MFSILEPRTRIPPHTGSNNVRTTVHLPLVVPRGCGFRVGAETRTLRGRQGLGVRRHDRARGLERQRRAAGDLHPRHLESAAQRGGAGRGPGGRLMRGAAPLAAAAAALLAAAPRRTPIPAERRCRARRAAARHRARRHGRAGARRARGAARRRRPLPARLRSRCRPGGDARPPGSPTAARSARRSRSRRAPGRSSMSAWPARPAGPTPEYARLREARAGADRRGPGAAAGQPGWSQRLIWPARGRISGAFGAQRIYRGGVPAAYHSGVDIAAGAGAPSSRRPTASSRWRRRRASASKAIWSSSITAWG